MAEVSPRRCPISRKPQILGVISFYRCAECGRILYYFDDESRIDLACCSRKMTEMVPEKAPNAFTYEILGGFDNNAVSVRWTCENPQWILLRGFVTVTQRLIAIQKKPPVIFPLADEDAYAYCGREVCQKCMYKCKKGFVLYILAKDDCLYSLPLDEMASYFKVIS